MGFRGYKYIHENIYSNIYIYIYMIYIDIYDFIKISYIFVLICRCIHSAVSGSSLELQPSSELERSPRPFMRRTLGASCAFISQVANSMRGRLIMCSPRTPS